MLCFFVAAAACAQDPSRPIESPQPPARIELRTGVTVSGDDYLRHLYASIGSARLRELLLDRVLEKATAAVDLQTVGNDTAATLRDPDAGARALLATRIAERHRGQRAVYLAALAAMEVTPQEDLWATRLEALRQARIAALVQSRRQPDAARLRRVFDEHYGVDGLRVVVRQVFQSFGAERHKAREAKQEVTEAEVEDNVRKRVAALMALHARGTPFHLLVARGSEDPKGRALALDPAQQEHAGEIDGYNFQQFGVEFADAVRAMQPGEVKGPLRTSHGYHIVRLQSATRTAYADVESKLRELLRQEAPSMAEARELLERLAREHGIDDALKR